jgi:release factor glutamine methyltransferase
VSDWRAGAAILKAAGIETSERDARILSREASDFDAAIARRALHEPVSHIIGKRAFWNHEFHVTSDVLDPRPDTESLIEAALEVPFERVLDLGTGSGCILISLLAERAEAHGLGIDLSPKALDVAQGNGTSIGVDVRCEWAVSDWFSAVSGQFDLIVSNPPYIDARTYAGLEQGVREFEPKMALTPGGDALEAYRIIGAQAGEYLAQGGCVMVEIGFDQGASVPAIFEGTGWGHIELRCDLNDHPRVVIARR